MADIERREAFVSVELDPAKNDDPIVFPVGGRIHVPYGATGLAGNRAED